MSNAQELIAELEQEARTTRKLLERTPVAKVAWKPHAKSWSLGDLAMHLANLVSWVSITLDTTEIDIAPVGAPPPKSPGFVSVAAMLAVFDANVNGAVAALRKASPADLQTGWTLKAGGSAKFTMPRAACLRTFVLSHLIHHRGQFSVYLRLCDVPVPSIYGPSADEQI